MSSSSSSSKSRHQIGMKAGMENIDRDQVNQVIHELSKESSYYRNEKRKEEDMMVNVRKMKAQLKQLQRQQQLFHRSTDSRTALDQTIASLEQTRDLSRTVLYVDMDMFYAAVEMRDNPELANVPLAVGGMSMISTTNYEARKYGVRAAMPGFIGRELCPHLQFCKPNFDKYKAVAEQVRAIISDYDPDYTSMGLDEAYLDVTDYLTRTNRIAWNVAEEIRRRIHEETKVTASCGIACNTMLAKIASDYNKPNGQFAILATKPDILAFMNKLSVRKIPGVGKVTESLLHELGVSTCQDVRESDVSVYLKHVLTPKLFKSLLRKSLGLSSADGAEREVSRFGVDEDEKGGGRKSYSRERTFKVIDRLPDIRDKLRQVCLRLCADLEADNNARGKTVTIKLKRTSFEVINRGQSFPNYIGSQDEMLNAVDQLFEKIIDELVPLPEDRAMFRIPLRLIGVRLSGLEADSIDKKSNSQSMTKFVETSSRGDNSRKSFINENLPTFIRPHKKAKKNPTKSSTSGKSKSIQSFFAAPKAATTLEPIAIFPCPICGKKERSAKGLQVHVNQCLDA